MIKHSCSFNYTIGGELSQYSIGGEKQWLLFSKKEPLVV